jgi:hypothetical protein
MLGSNGSLSYSKSEFSGSERTWIPSGRPFRLRRWTLTTMGYNNTELSTTINVTAQRILPIMAVRHIRGSVVASSGSSTGSAAGLARKKELAEGGSQITYSATFGQELWTLHGIRSSRRVKSQLHHNIANRRARSNADGGYVAPQVSRNH